MYEANTSSRSLQVVCQLIDNTRHGWAPLGVLAPHVLDQQQERRRVFSQSLHWRPHLLVSYSLVQLMLCQVMVRVSKLGPRQNLPENQSTSIDVHLFRIRGVRRPELGGLPVGSPTLCVHGCIRLRPDPRKPKVVDLGTVVRGDLERVA